MLKIFFLVYHGTINLPCNSSFVLSDRLVGRTKNILFKASSCAFRPNRVKSGSLFLAAVNFRSTLILHWICAKILFGPNNKLKKLSHPILSTFPFGVGSYLYTWTVHQTKYQGVFLNFQGNTFFIRLKVWVNLNLSKRETKNMKMCSYENVFIWRSSLLKSQCNGNFNLFKVFEPMLNPTRPVEYSILLPKLF